jgi:hypothetical protein
VCLSFVDFQFEINPHIINLAHKSALELEGGDASDKGSREGGGEVKRVEDEKHEASRRGTVG